MMNTAVGLVDGKNIGRILYHQTDPITVTSSFNIPSSIISSSTLQQWTESYSATTCAKAINSGSATQPLSQPWLNYQPIISDLSYYSLPFENTITIFGNVYVEKYSAPTLNASLVLALRFTVWTPVTSSYEYFGLSGNQDPSNLDIGYQAGVSGSVAYSPVNGGLLDIPSTATLPTAFASGSKSVWTPFKAIINLPSGSQDKINNVDLDYAFFKMNRAGASAGTDFAFRAKFANFAVMTSRTLASQASSGIGDFELNDYDPGGGAA